MKYLKSYKLINDNNNFFDLKEILQDVKDICLELEDQGLSVQVYPQDDIKIKNYLNI